MADPKKNLVASWQKKAERDLYSAKKLASGDSPCFDTAVYHCQQAAEKILKGFLSFHDIQFSKTHDLRVLIESAIRIENEFEAFLDVTETLNPYATAFRYPGEMEDPTAEEFEQAYKSAEAWIQFVTSISKGVT